MSGRALHLHPHREPCNFRWMVQSIDASRSDPVLHRSLLLLRSPGNGFKVHRWGYSATGGDMRLLIDPAPRFAVYADHVLSASQARSYGNHASKASLTSLSCKYVAGFAWWREMEGTSSWLIKLTVLYPSRNTTSAKTMALLAAIDSILNQARAERNELQRFWLQQLDGWETGQLLLGVVIHESFCKLHFTIIISGVSCVMFHPISLLLFGTSRWMPAMPIGSDLEIVKAKDLSSFNRIDCMTLRFQQLFRHVTRFINTPNSYQSKLAIVYEQYCIWVWCETYQRLERYLLET